MPIGTSEFLARALELGLIQADATNPELDAALSLSRRLGMHHQAGMRRMGLPPKDIPGRGEMYHQALIDFREGDPDLAETAIPRIADRVEAATLRVARPTRLSLTSRPARSARNRIGAGPLANPDRSYDNDRPRQQVATRRLPMSRPPCRVAPPPLPISNSDPSVRPPGSTRRPP